MDFVTIAETHAGKTELLAGTNVSLPEQQAKVKAIRRAGESHKDYARVSIVPVTGDSYRFVSPDDLKKRQAAQAKEQAELKKLADEAKAKEAKAPEKPADKPAK